MRLDFRAGLAVMAAALLVSGCGDALPESTPSDETSVNDVGSGEPLPAAVPQDVIGLVTSLPIVWREGGSMSDLLNDDRPSHWALGALRSMGAVRPLDSLADPSGALPLSADGWLVLAQPYPLSPQENVALDNWVRAGGRVLLFADPMLTQDSAYALGDRRRPQDVILLSPILNRWGLELRFDEDQPRGEREVRIDKTALPVNLLGAFAVSGKDANCALAAQGLIATCTIGRGRLVAVADAALLEDVPADAVNARISALVSLMRRLGR